MAAHDEWCDLCNDKLKEVDVKYEGKTITICKHCSQMYDNPIDLLNNERK